MKRILLWFMSTLTVLVLLFGYKTSTSGSALDASNSAALPAIASTPSSTATHSSSANRSKTSAASGSKTTTKTNAAKKTAATTTKKPTTTTTKKTVTGSVVETQYGPVQVQLKIVNGKITGVEVLQYPSGGRSDEINAAALPILINETMQAQSAHIDMVSGATYTSNGYLESLQSALDKAALS